MRINWFSPLPPQPTGVAEFTALVLPELARQADVTVWTDQDEVDPQLLQYAKLQRFTSQDVSWPQLNVAEATFFNLGNNGPFHLAALQVLSRHAGLVVLHDLCLHGLVEYQYRNVLDDQAGYIGTLVRLYGESARQPAEDYWRTGYSGTGENLLAMYERYPCVEIALEHALAVLTHTETVATYTRAVPGTAVVTAELPFERSGDTRLPPAAVVDMSAPIQLIIFGHIGANRRLEQVLEALALVDQPDHFRLQVLGQVWDSLAIEQRVRQLNLDRVVTLRGYVTDAELDLALASADLAINLRYPTMGEASISQLRIWSYGLPSLVTRTGWYAALPQDVVGFVEPEREIHDLQMHFGALQADRARYRRLGLAGKRWVHEQHGVTAYVEVLLEMARCVPALRPQHVARVQAARIGAVCGRHGWIPPELGSDVFQRTARALGYLLTQ